jgi:TetR/AcrR family transcriptional regulator, transcriptional repressor for nem operon
MIPLIYVTIGRPLAVVDATGAPRRRCMRKSKAETAKTRQRIVDVAAQAFRSNGVAATGVAEIMAAAGLTHGGFYRHFGSKDQLLAEACSAGLDSMVRSYRRASESGRETFVKHLQGSLTPAYRDHREGGCPLVAMGSELARADDATRRGASRGFQDLVDEIAGWLPARPGREVRDEAIAVLTGMIGAVTMSRVVGDARLSARILRAGRDDLSRRFATSPRAPRTGVSGKRRA